MPEGTSKPTKVFTLDEANACLPLVKAITGDMVQLSRDLIERARRLEHLNAGRQREQGDLYAEELAQIEDELAKDSKRLKEYINELLELGVEPKSAPDGLIDFPAMMDGRLVYLCWRFDEPEVLFWHELDSGFAGRQPLTIGSGASGDHGETGGLA